MTVLLLAGTGEAVALAQALADQGVPAIASLAGATRTPRDLALPTRHGGFGGAEAFEHFLTKHEISAVLDATHPFAHRMSHRTAGICRALGLPYRQFLRPPWVPSHQDSWTMLRNEEAAADVIAPGSTVFLATGRQTLERFANLASCRLICRQIDPPDGPFPFPNGQFLVGRPPFSVEDEVTLFQGLGVDWLVVKNAGGAASFSKLEAARRLELPVAMIERPVQPDELKFSTLEEAMAWVSAL